VDLTSTSEPTVPRYHVDEESNVRIRDFFAIGSDDDLSEEEIVEAAAPRGLPTRSATKAKAARIEKDETSEEDEPTTPAKKTTRSGKGRQEPDSSDEEAAGASHSAPLADAFAIPTSKLSKFNQAQLRTLRKAEYRRWASLLASAFNERNGFLTSMDVTRLEERSTAFSFLIYRYRGCLTPDERRVYLKHRQNVNQLSVDRWERTGSRAVSTTMKEQLHGSPDTPFYHEEFAYQRAATVNSPRTSGTWTWDRNIVRHTRPE
jgi:hypothetical protein